MEKRLGRPRTGVTPHRSVRVGRSWDQAKVVARERGDKMSDIITKALEEYVAKYREWTHPL